MPSVTFDRFDGGLDVRRGASVSDANRLRVLTNAHVTTGKTLQKRPCLRKVATLEAGTVGLRAGLGKLQTFYGTGSVVHADTLFQANFLPHPTLAQAITKVHYGEVFNGYLYAVAQYADATTFHHYLDDPGVWATLTAHAAGVFRRPTVVNGFRYEVTTAGTTGVAEPLWPTTVGASVTDGTDDPGVWVTLTAYTLGQLRRPTVANGLRYKVTTAGTAAAGEPVWPLTVGGTVVDGTVTWTCVAAVVWTCRSRAIADTNCPHTKEVIKQQSKIYARGDETVRYCATNAPRDWTTASDAGFLPTGLQAQGSTTCTALGQFGQKKLTVFFADGIQVWNVDPNPTLNSLESLVPNLGTRYSKTPLGFSGDMFFLADAGFRSITVSAITDNLQDVDVGNAIDSLVLPTLNSSSDLQSVFYAGLGQFWCIDGQTVWVYAFSRTSKLAAWSTFQLPVNVDDRAVLNGDLYIRSGNAVYILDRDVYADDGAVPTVTIEMPFLDFKTPGVLKQIIGVDVVGAGTASLQLRFDPRDPTKITSEIPIISGSDMRPGPMTAVEICAEAIAPVITHAADEDFRLDAITFYYENLNYGV